MRAVPVIPSWCWKRPRVRRPWISLSKASPALNCMPAFWVAKVWEMEKISSDALQNTIGQHQTQDTLQDKCDSQILHQVASKWYWATRQQTPVLCLSVCYCNLQVWIRNTWHFSTQCWWQQLLEHDQQGTKQEAGKAAETINRFHAQTCLKGKQAEALVQQTECHGPTRSTDAEVLSYKSLRYNCHSLQAKTHTWEQTPVLDRGSCRMAERWSSHSSNPGFCTMYTPMPYRILS